MATTYTPSTHIDISGESSLEALQFSSLEGVSGAAIGIASTGNLTLGDSLLQENAAEYFGGAISCEGILALKEGVLFQGNTAQFGGALYNGGTTTIGDCALSQNRSTLTGGAMDNGGVLLVTGTTCSHNDSAMGGVLFNSGTASFTDCLFAGNAASADGGVAENYATLVITGCTFSRNAAANGGAIDNTDGGKLTLTDVCFDGNTASSKGGAIYNGTASTATLSDVAFLTAYDTIYNDGTMVFSGTISLAGTLTTSSAITATGVSLAFDISRYAAGCDAAIVGDWTKLTGVADYALNVSENQAEGGYALAGKASGFAATISLQCGEFAAMALAVGGSAVYHNSVYTLSQTEGTLAVAAADFAAAGSAEALSWGEINGAASYALEIVKDDEAAVAAVSLTTEGADLLGLADGGYAWRVRNAAEADNWQDGQAFAQSGAPEEPQLLSAETNGATDLFFVTTDGVWDDAYVARHVGVKDGWNGTGETVELAGKRRVVDIFAGSEDASILFLDAFGENGAAGTRSVELAATGVALFLDDIYSAAPSRVPDAGASGRLSRIDTIIGSAGDDLVDLTSQRFDFGGGGVTVLGGGGDDVIWLGEGDNTVAGGAGDDRVVGCGGVDTLCFGDGWGVDTVLQRDGGTVVLWFKEAYGTWDPDAKSYSDGTNRVSVEGDGVMVEVRIGAVAGHEAEYARLAALGAFA